MAVERVRITPSNITLKDSSGNIIFDTDRQYLKTGGGTLYAGGNTRSPMVTGQNSITDKTDYGGYVTGFLSNAVSFTQSQNWTFWYYVPKSTTINLKYSEVWVPSGSPAYIYTSPNTRYIYYYNYNTGVRSQTSARFKWQVGRLDNSVTGESYDGIWPILIDSMPVPTNAAGGRYDFEWSANEHLNYTNTVSGVDGYGNAYTTTYNASNYLGTLKPRFHGTFHTRSPVALALAVTP